MANDTEKRITAKMVLDSSGFNSSLQGVNQQLKLAQSELKASSAQVGVFGKETDKLKVNSEGLSKQIELQRQKVDIYKDSIEKSTQKLQETIKARDTLKGKLQEETVKYNEAIKVYGKESEEALKAKDSVDKLTEEYKKKEKQVESTAKSINNYTTNMNKADAELAKLQGELNKTNKELDKSNNKWLQASETLKKSSEKFKNAGETIDKAGNSLLKISAPLIAGGVASAKFAMDFQSSMGKVSTISDDTQVPLEELGKGVLKLSNDTGIAATDIANNVYDAISAGQSTGDAVNFVTNSTKLAKAGFAEAADSLDILTTILNAYKMKSEEVTNVSDILIQVQNKGKVTVGELSSVMGKVIPTAVATNTNLKQLGAGYALMTANGIKAAESTTYINSMLNELSKTGTDADKALRKVSGKSFSDLMKEGKNLSDVLIMLDGYAKKNKLSLKDMFGSAEAGKAALVLSTNAGKDFNSMLKDMDTSTGSTNAAFEKVNNTAEAKLNKSLNELKNNAIKLGQSLLPVVDNISGAIGTLADKISKMDEKQLKTIADIALFTAGFGGVLKITGGVVTGIGNVVGIVGKLSGALGTAAVATEEVGAVAGVAAGASGIGGLAALGTSLGGLAIAAAPWLVAGAAVVGTGYAINKAMSEEAVPAVDLFADKVNTTTKVIETAHGTMSTQIEKDTIKISQSTQKAVGAYIKMDDDVTKSMLDIQLNSSKITNDTANQLTTKFNNMGTQIKAGMDNKYNGMYATLQTFFKESGALSDAEEAESLAKLKQNNEFQKSTVDQGTKEIKAILDKASKEKRELTAEERSVIGNIQDNMKQDAIKSLSETEIESKIIMERLKGYSERITAEQAADTIKKANETRDKAVAAANDQYSKTISDIIKMRDESHIITADQAEKLLKNAAKQRDDSIQKADEMKNGVVNKIKEMNPNIVDEVNIQTGTIMNGWDKLKKWWNDLWFPKKKMEVETVVIGNNNIKDYSGSYNTMRMNYTGNDSFEGGYTTLHEKGYEVYDLPRGTKIYNHDASEDLVIKTAQKVAQSVLNGVNASNSPTQTIIVPVNLEGKEIARIVTPIISNNLAMATTRRRY